MVKLLPNFVLQGKWDMSQREEGVRNRPWLEMNLVILPKITKSLEHGRKFFLEVNFYWRSVEVSV